MLELSIILALLVLNGIFAMAEIAILSAKKSRLQELVNTGDAKTSAGASAAIKLAEQPEDFLSTVQVGITLVSVIASAFGGATLQGYVKTWLEGSWMTAIPLVKENLDRWAFVIVVAFITLLSVIVGELVPKSLALRNSVSIACKTSQLMRFLSKISFPLVWFLGKTTNLLLKPFGEAKPEEDHHRNDLMILVREGVVNGAVQRGEEYLVREAMRFSQSVAEEVMVPKPKIVFIHVDDTHEEIVASIKDAPHRVFPVYKENRDSIIGLVSIESLYSWAINYPGQAIEWAKITHKVEAVPENQPLDTLYNELLQTPLGGGLVVDEFGTVRGLVTLNELMEESLSPSRTRRSPERLEGMPPCGRIGQMEEA
jgi:putative hemolysin